MIKSITGAVTLSLMATTALAGGIDRSGQSISAIFESGNYAELSFGSVNPSVTGTAAGQASGNMAASYTQFGFAIKSQVNENLSIGIIYDQPFGADVAYPAGTTYPFTGATATLDSNAVTAVARYSFGNGFAAHAGIRHQSMDANIAIPAVAGYTATASSGSGTGYVAGISYEKPEIALRVALTYNSEIESTHSTSEATAVPAALVSNTTITTPKSWNLEAQTGIAEGTLLFGSVRWVNWDGFTIDPALYRATVGSALLAYTDNSTTYTLGVGKRINDDWSVSLSAVHEASAGGTQSNLGPTDGRTGITLGARYTMDNVTISGGLNYTWVGDATTVVSAVGPVLSSFTDNHVVGAGVRIGVNF
jgi:long-subunit fatty acid transport protein